MVASAILTTTGQTADKTAFNLVPTFSSVNDEGESTDLSGPYWVCEFVRLQAGANPSYALVRIPNKALDDTGPQIACINTSPVQSIKGLSTCNVKYLNNSDQGVTLIRGHPVLITQNFAASQDEAIIMIMDGRYLLKGIPIVGSFWMSGDDDTDIGYRRGWHWMPNHKNRPNAIYRDGTGSAYTPVMCDPYYGGFEDRTIPDPDSRPTHAATWWTNLMCLEHLVYRLTAEADVIAAAEFPAYNTLADGLDGIVVPDGIVNTIRDASNSSAKAEAVDYSGWTWIDAFTKIVRDSGPFDVYLQPGEVQTLEIISTRYTSGGITIKRPMSGDAEDELDDPKIVVGGSYIENFQNLYTRFTTQGDLVFVETRVNSTDANDGNLQEAWGAVTSSFARTFMQAESDLGTDENEARKALSKHFPHFGAAYHINPSYDFLTGLTESDSDRSLLAIKRPILPHLLTSYLQDDGEATVAEKASFRRPVPVEFQNEGQDPDADSWFLTFENNGFKRFADGTIWFEGLRDQNLTYTIKGWNSNNVTLHPRHLRITCAVPADHGIMESRATPNDTSAVAEPLIVEAGYGERVAVGVARHLFSEPRGLFGKEIRDAGAFPEPETVTGATAPGEKTIRDDSALLSQHVERRGKDVGRVEVGGRLIIPHITSNFFPGLAVRGLQNDNGVFRIGAMIQAINITNKSRGSGNSKTLSQFTTCELGNVVDPQASAKEIIARIPKPEPEE